jgi:hypothetical protein
MHKSVITATISLIAALNALPLVNYSHDDLYASPSEKAQEGHGTDCSSDHCKVIYKYSGDHLPSIGPNKEFSYFQAGDFVANDAKLSSSCRGLTINSYPYTIYGEGILDHVKFLIFTNRVFNVPKKGEMSFNAKLSMEAIGIQNHPFGAQVQDPQSDFRLAASAFNVLSLSNGFIFDFIITNTKIYALYERLDIARGVFGNYAAFTFAIPVVDIRPLETHLYTISFNGQEKSVRWLVDNNEVYKVFMTGTLVSRQFMGLDLGGQEEILFPTSLQIGFGTFTILDAYSPCNVLTPALDGGSICQFPDNEMGLTQLTPLGYELNPRTGASPAQFETDGSNVADHIWGQGTILKLEKIFVRLCQN